MHFPAIKLILTLFLLHLGICFAMENPSGGSSSGGRNAKIKSANCRGRAYKKSVLRSAVVRGVDLLQDISRNRDFSIAIAAYHPSRGEYMRLEGPYFVYPFWQNGREVTEEDVVIYTKEGKLVKVAVHYQIPYAQQQYVAWAYEDCDLTFK